MTYKALIALLELADYDAGQVVRMSVFHELSDAGWVESGETDDEADGYRYVYLTDKGKAMVQLLLSTATIHASK